MIKVMFNSFKLNRIELAIRIYFLDSIKSELDFSLEDDLEVSYKFNLSEFC